MSLSSDSRLIVAGIVLLSASACNGGVSAEEFEACMSDGQHTISASIDAGSDPEQTYKQAMDDCGFGKLSDANATSSSTANESSSEPPQTQTELLQRPAPDRFVNHQPRAQYGQSRALRYKS